MNSGLDDGGKRMLPALLSRHVVASSVFGLRLAVLRTRQ